MASPIEIQIHGPEQLQPSQPSPTSKPPPLRRPRHYVQRVRDSFTTQVGKMLCSCFLGLLFVLGLLAFILWLSLRPHRPRFHLTSFSATGLSEDYGFLKADISFNVSVRNPNQNVDIYFDTMDGTVFYREQQVGTTPVVPPYHQPRKSTAAVNGNITGAPLMVTDATWNQSVAAGTVMFRLELTSRIRFKVASLETGWHRMHSSCDAGVGPDGQIAQAYKDRKCSIYFF